jgi:nucleoside-diphosphate-sugar epimerase
MRLALEAPVADGQRIFITDGAQTTWADLVSALSPLAEARGPVPVITAGQARELYRDAPPPSLRAALKHLLSPGVRSTLMKDPFLLRAEKSVKDAIKRLPSLERALRRRFESRSPARRTGRDPGWSAWFIRQQLRNFRYSQVRAQAVLGYEPVVTFEQSVKAFRGWYAELFGWRDTSWPLVRHLWQTTER